MALEVPQGDQRPQGDRPSGPLTDAEKARIEQLFAEGMGRNAIARELRRDWMAITYYCRKHGMSFAREDAAIGAEAKRRLAAERRAELALALLDDVERIRDQLFAETTYVQYVGKDGLRVTDTLDEPTAADKRNLASAAVALLDRAVKLDDYDKTGGQDAARMFLGKIIDVINGPILPPAPDSPAVLEGGDGAGPGIPSQ